MDKLCSIIVPVYNGEKYLEECLKSIAKQTYPNIEVIIIDDGSADRSAQICAKFVETDHRFRLYRQANAGVSASRNKGIKLANGEFIIFVDADDLLESDSVELLLKEIDDNVDLVIGSHVYFRGNKLKYRIWENKVYNKQDINKDILYFHKTLLTPWAKIYRRSIITENDLKFDPSIPYGEDTVFNYGYIQYIDNVKLISHKVYKYRMDGVASAVRYYSNRAGFEKAIFEARCSMFDSAQSVPKAFYNEILFSAVISSVGHYLEHLKKKEAIEKIKQTLQLFLPYISRTKLVSDNHSPDVLKGINEMDAELLYKALYRERFIRVLAKKVKLGIKGRKL